MNVSLAPVFPGIGRAGLVYSSLRAGSVAPEVLCSKGKSEWIVRYMRLILS